MRVRVVMACHLPNGAASICLILYLAVSVPYVATETNSTTLKEGETFTIICAATDMSQFGFVRVLKLVQDLGPYTIVTNEILGETFDGLLYNGQKRYNAHYDLIQKDNQHDANLELTITGVQGEDAGLIQCDVEGRIIYEEELIVTVPVSGLLEIKSSDDDQSDGITLKTMEASWVSCVLTMYNAPYFPNLTALVDGKEYGEFDLTENMTAEARADQQGLVDVEYVVELMYRTSVPNGKLNGKRLLCEAYTLGYEDIKIQKDVNLIVEFSPLIMCDSHEHWGEIGDEMSFTCSVLANPKADIFMLFGYEYDDESYELEEPGVEEVGDYILQREDFDGYSNVTFTIKSLDEKHYAYKYRIEASNLYSLADHKAYYNAEVFEGKDPGLDIQFITTSMDHPTTTPTVDTGGSSRLMTSSVLLVTLLLCLAL